MTTLNDDNRALIVAQRAEVFDLITDNMNRAWAALNDLPDEQRVPAQQALAAAHQQYRELTDLIDRAQDALAHADAVQQTMLAALNQLAQQRNAAIDEAAQLTRELEADRDQVHEQAYEAVILSLQYDIAAELGIDHYDASILYDLLNGDLDDIEDIHGIPASTANNFRIVVIKMLAAVKEQSDAQA